MVDVNFSPHEFAYGRGEISHKGIWVDGGFFPPVNRTVLSILTMVLTSQQRS